MFKILEWTLYICLSIISIIFVWKIVDKFNSEDVSFKQYKESIKEQPVFTLCFDTGVNVYNLGSEVNIRRRS